MHSVNALAQSCSLCGIFSSCFTLHVVMFCATFASLCDSDCFLPLWRAPAIIVAVVNAAVFVVFVCCLFGGLLLACLLACLVAGGWGSARMLGWVVGVCLWVVCGWFLVPGSWWLASGFWLRGVGCGGCGGACPWRGLAASRAPVEP